MDCFFNLLGRMCFDAYVQQVPSDVSSPVQDSLEEPHLSGHGRICRHLTDG
jgi:hypothetical protein